MQILKKISVRLALGILVFFLCNGIYSRFFYEKDVRKYSRVKMAIDTAFAQGEIIYMGESSNTSFNPWTDTLNYAISDFLRMYLPEKKVTAITHESFHPGLFLEMLNLLPNDGRKRTLVVTMNMRTCGPSAIHSSNEAPNRQEALFYSRRLPLLTRIFLSLHFYDNRNEKERERMKFRQWRTENLNTIHPDIARPENVKTWLHHLSQEQAPEKWKMIADAYVKEFAFVIDENNPRVKDLDCIAEICKKRNIRLILHLLPENRDYARMLFDQMLLSLMDYNAQFLEDHFSRKGVEVVNNYRISAGNQYTDQWYPTEHINGELRRSIAQNIARKLAPQKTLPALQFKANNFPDWSKHQPMADTLLTQQGPWKMK